MRRIIIARATGSRRESVIPAPLGDPAAYDPPEAPHKVPSDLNFCSELRVCLIAGNCSQIEKAVAAPFSLFSCLGLIQIVKYLALHPFPVM